MDEPFLRVSAGKFLHQLFLGMNIALPGSFNLYESAYAERPEGVYGPPNLSSDVLEFAFVHAKDREWPPIVQLDFASVWKWITEELP